MTFSGFLCKVIGFSCKAEHSEAHNLRIQWGICELVESGQDVWCKMLQTRCTAFLNLLFNLFGHRPFQWQQATTQWHLQAVGCNSLVRLEESNQNLCQATWTALNFMSVEDLKSNLVLNHRDKGPWPDATWTWTLQRAGSSTRKRKGPQHPKWRQRAERGSCPSSARPARRVRAAFKLVIPSRLQREVSHSDSNFRAAFKLVSPSHLQVSWSESPSS